MGGVLGVGGWERTEQGRVMVHGARGMGIILCSPYATTNSAMPCIQTIL